MGSVRRGQLVGRDAFAQALGGLSGETIRKVEYGYQNLGKSARLLFDRLAQNTAPRELHEELAPYGTPVPATPAPTAQQIADIALDEGRRTRAAEVARAAGVDIRQALEWLIRNELENGKQ